MVLDALGERLRGALDKISKALFVDETLVNELVREIQRALLQADVNVKLVFEISKNIKTRALKEESPGLDKKEQLVKIVYEELVNFLGKEKYELKTVNSKIMLLGLFGSGKTTTTGKLAKYYTKRGKKVAVVGLDVWRPAAMKQLETVAKEAKVDCFIDKEEKNPVKIWEKNKEKLDDYDIVLVDTAGRDALSQDLIEEIEQVTKTINPDEKLLIISADIGQAAQAQAEQFHKSVNITGVIITKMDGTAKGGGALTACAITKAPIVFVGLGEHQDDLESFNPQGFVSRMLGMGDISALMEKAEVALKDSSKDDAKKFLKGEFNLTDLYDQMNSMKNMGSFSKLMELIPGFSQMKIPKEALQVQEGKLEKWKYIIDSCTPKERSDPDVMNGSRVERIAKGSGTSVQEVRELLKQYKQSKKLMKTFGGSEKKMEKMMKRMGGGMNLG